MSFLQRVQQLPRLGLGVSTEYGAGDVPGALDPQALRDHNPRYGGFLEVGVELARGLDRHARAWAARGQPRAPLGQPGAATASVTRLDDTHGPISTPTPFANCIHLPRWRGGLGKNGKNVPWE